MLSTASPPSLLLPPQQPPQPKLRPWLPLLCDMTQLDGRDEHRDLRSTYVLWVLDDGSNVVFLHKHLLNRIEYGGRRFIDWLVVKPVDECCRMISRTLLASLRYKPDYIVLVNNEHDCGAPYATDHSMATMLKAVEGCPTLRNIRTAAEGVDPMLALQGMHPMVTNNLLGRRLSELCGVLADRGFFSDPRNRVRYGKPMPMYGGDESIKI
jgi:hypothetical protein